MPEAILFVVAVFGLGATVGILVAVLRERKRANLWINAVTHRSRSATRQSQVKLEIADLTAKGEDIQRQGHLPWDRHQSTAPDRSVEKLSFSMLPGEVLALLGPRGSGRRTLVECISGLLPVEAGRMYIDGLEVQSSRPRFLLDAGSPLVGLVRSSDEIPRATLLSATIESIADPLLSIQARQERAHTALQNLGVYDHADSGLTDLPTGVVQRARLAFALVNDPEILVLDDAFLRLDQRADKEEWSDLIDTLRLLEQTTLLASHIIDLGLLADRVLLIDRGLLVGEMRAVDLPEWVQQKGNRAFARQLEAM
jgi:ABC-type multidrug transport system ATPase subunit